MHFRIQHSNVVIMTKLTKSSKYLKIGNLENFNNVDDLMNLTKCLLKSVGQLLCVHVCVFVCCK